MWVVTGKPDAKAFFTLELQDVLANILGHVGQSGRLLLSDHKGNQALNFAKMMN